MKHRFTILAVLLLLLSACGGKKQDTAATADEKKTPTFTLPEVPVMLQSPEDRMNFVVQHYWDNFDFKDTAYIHLPDVTEQAIVDYLDLLARVPIALSDTCLMQTMQAASSAATAASVHAQTVEKSAQAHERMAREVEQTRETLSQFGS